MYCSVFFSMEEFSGTLHCMRMYFAEQNETCRIARNVDSFDDASEDTPGNRENKTIVFGDDIDY